MQLLGVEWREKLNVNATLKVADGMNVIYRDISESMQLKPKAIRLQAILLLQAYKKNLSEDPAIKALMKESEGSSRDYIQEFQSGRIELSEKTTHTNKSILNRINISATEQLEIFSGNQSSTPAKIQIIEAWTRWKKYNLDPPEVSQCLFSAISNYKNFDSELWVPLAEANVEDFENQNASVKLKEMISEAKSEDIKKRLQLLVRKNTAGNQID